MSLALFTLNSTTKNNEAERSFVQVAMATQEGYGRVPGLQKAKEGLSSL